MYRFNSDNVYYIDLPYDMDVGGTNIYYYPSLTGCTVTSRHVCLNDGICDETTLFSQFGLIVSDANGWV
jgi:hypothetical protein